MYCVLQKFVNTLKIYLKGTNDDYKKKVCFARMASEREQTFFFKNEENLVHKITNRWRYDA